MFSKKWNNKDVVDRLLSLKEENVYTEIEIANILNREFTEHTYTSDSVGNFYRRWRNKERDILTEEEVEKETARTARRLLQAQDTNRIERNVWRNVSRYETFFETYIDELKELITDVDMSYFKVNMVKEEPKKHVYGIIHLSDLHFNEIVNIPENKYDFNVASCRLKKLADETICEFKTNGVTDVIIACTGDFINSDRRIDELLSMATSRARAVFVGVMLLKSFITDIYKEFNSISFAGVTGNESRIQKELGFSELAASDNYDMTIYNILAMLFNGTRVNFYLGNPSEQILNLDGTNVLLFHGNNLPRAVNIENKVSEVISKYAKQGINIRYALFGHYHSPIISNEFARSGSLVGANAYSSYDLNFTSKASQNIFILEGNNVKAILVDLQEYNKDTNYDLTEALQRYNVTNALPTQTNIFKIG